MESRDNIMFVCKECSQEMYPKKGTFDPKVGDSIKLKFSESGRNEYMWVNVTKCDGEKYEGVLDNDPIFIEGLKCGDNVKFGKDEILDIYQD